MIAGASLLIGIFFIYCSLGASAERFVEVKVVPVEASSRARALPPVAFDSFAYYQTIIDNNIFRPLGWTPPHPVESYRLIGTILPTDTHIPPKAILQSTTGNTTHIVTRGDRVDTDPHIVDIQPKQIKLSTNGKTRTLHLSIRF